VVRAQPDAVGDHHRLWFREVAMLLRSDFGVPGPEGQVAISTLRIVQQAGDVRVTRLGFAADSAAWMLMEAPPAGTSGYPGWMR